MGRAEDGPARVTPGGPSRAASAGGAACPPRGGGCRARRRNGRPGPPALRSGAGARGGAPRSAGGRRTAARSPRPRTARARLRQDVAQIAQETVAHVDRRAGQAAGRETRLDQRLRPELGADGRRQDARGRLLPGSAQQAKAEGSLAQLADQDDRVPRPRRAASAGPGRLPERGERDRPRAGAGDVPPDEGASVPPRQGRHAAAHAARGAQRVRSRAHAQGAEKPARPRRGRGEIAERRGERLVPHVRGREPAPVEVDALDQLVDLQDQLPPGGRTHHGAVVARPGQHARAGRAGVAGESEGSEEGVDEQELVHLGVHAMTSVP